ncbi:MAG: DNA polymerase IV, partial [Thermodesulfobacteriota bacterium]
MSSGANIMHLDMDAFFASVEQCVNPALRGRAIAVVGSAKRTVVTTSSYEARALGVRTGMNRFEAKKQCPSLIFVSGNNAKYMDVSTRIMEIIKTFSPLVEVYSIDEAFIDI